MIQKANVREVALTSHDLSKGDQAVNLLVKAMRKEDHAVHIDLEAKLKEVTAEGLHADTVPGGALVDELATAIENKFKVRFFKN